MLARTTGVRPRAHARMAARVVVDCPTKLILADERKPQSSTPDAATGADHVLIQALLANVA